MGAGAIGTIGRTAGLFGAMFVAQSSDELGWKMEPRAAMAVRPDECLPCAVPLAAQDAILFASPSLPLDGRVAPPFVAAIGVVEALPRPTVVEEAAVALAFWLSFFFKKL